MSKKSLITTLIVALPFVVACDNQGESRGTGGAQEQQDTSTTDAEVIDSRTTIIDQQPAQIQEQEVEEGTTDVQYQTTREVTETVLREQEIPTVQVCNSKANINEMDKEDFRAVGFDQQTAERIVQTREQKGQFSSVDELSQVSGASDTLSQIRNDLGVVERQAQEEK